MNVQCCWNLKYGRTSVILSRHITNRGRGNLNVFTQGNQIFPHTSVKYTHRCSLFWLKCFTSSQLRCHTTSSLICELRKTSHEVESTTKPYAELQKTYILLPSIPDVTLQAHYFLFPLKTQFHFGYTLAVSLGHKNCLNWDQWCTVWLLPGGGRNINP